MSDDPLLDEDRIDIDELKDRGTDAELYAHEDWLDSVANRIDYDDASGSGTFDPDSYDDPRDWLTDELAALLIRAHEETDMGMLSFSGGLKTMDEQIINIADIGVQHYAKKVDRRHEFGPSRGGVEHHTDDSEFTEIGIEEDDE